MFNEHQLRERAYYIWEKEGRHLGQAESHWYKAQAELQAGAAVAGSTKSPAKALAKAAKPAASRTKASPKAATAARKSPRAAATDAAAFH